MKNVLEYLEHTAARLPHKTGAEDKNGSVTFAQLLELSQRTGSALAGKLFRGSLWPFLWKKASQP